MRVMAWNTGWNVTASKVSTQTDAVAQLDADVAFFSEWSPSATRTISGGRTRGSGGHTRGPALAANGFVHQCQQHVLDYAGDGREWRKLYWGILAASRQPIVKVELDPPLFAPSTWLEVEHVESGLTLVGVRLPAWDGNDAGLRRVTWRWMVEQFDRLATAPAVVLGDFNTEMRYATEGRQRRYGGDLLRSLTAERGWRDAFDAAGVPKTDTYVRNNGAGTRVDYAFVSPGFSGAVGAAAPERVGEHTLLRRPASRGRDRVPGLSDHAPVVVDLQPSVLAREDKRDDTD